MEWLALGVSMCQLRFVGAGRACQNIVLRWPTSPAPWQDLPVLDDPALRIQAEDVDAGPSRFASVGHC